MASKELHISLLRPAILHILRAAGFHAARPSVIDALTDITARYLVLLGQRTAVHAFSNHNDLEPDVTDVRMALQDCGLLIPTLTGPEEAWKEALRKPLEEYPERNGIQTKEQLRRDAEDTKEVREFVEWVKGEQNKEIRKFAGVTVNAENQTIENEMTGLAEDYLTALKKKHSKTGEESRYQGTVLGKLAEDRPIKIEGGSVESIRDWILRTQERAAQEAAVAQRNGHPDGSAESSPATLANSSGGTVDDPGVAMDITT